jgi:hypothetical protein
MSLGYILGDFFFSQSHLVGLFPAQKIWRPKFGLT